MNYKKENSKNKDKKENKKIEDDVIQKSNNESDTNEDEKNNQKNNEGKELIEEKIKEKEDELLEEIASLKEEKIRLLAEMENIRKRFEREKIESIKFGSINLARDILSPGDNIERALSAIPDDIEHSDSIKNLIDGLNIVQKEFSTILEKNGIKRIESLDKKFDPTLHQAMMEIEKEDIEEGTVVQEIQAGYTMHERLLRPAMVGVSKKSLSKNSNATEVEEMTNEKAKQNKDK
ncbi:MAG: Protein GrpE [Alphaproteobacteria bacterium MarineAlpha5_Bin5]|nr:MAG: Protein GrpE [Alphaproteobacteria bacterium MarineAlpha5_Bin5]PPR52742.1 MAG: Protein GrpE [Alphaproteobacteria bacterium MarineAlpha5_Bin4]|tara:strand:- start:921 stop:1622 length:702 start_codon:yes stop_codon:yes gene_type:complete